MNPQIRFPPILHGNPEVYAKPRVRQTNALSTENIFLPRSERRPTYLSVYKIRHYLATTPAGEADPVKLHRMCRYLLKKFDDTVFGTYDSTQLFLTDQMPETHLVATDLGDI